MEKLKYKSSYIENKDKPRLFNEYYKKGIPASHKRMRQDINEGALAYYKGNDIATSSGYHSQYTLAEFLRWNYVNGIGYDFVVNKEDLLPLNPALEPYLRDIGNLIEGKSKCQYVESKTLSFSEGKFGKFHLLSVHYYNTENYLGDRLAIIPHDIFKPFYLTEGNGLTLDFDPPNKIIFGNDYGIKIPKTPFTQLFEKWEVKNFTEILKERKSGI